MIVNYKEEGWQVITQRAHGIVAAQIAFQWRIKDRPQRWVEMVLAIAEHDDAENELDGENLLTPTGGPLNFDMKVFELPHCIKLASLTITKSRYIALLTSMHMEFLYNKDKAADPEATAFLQEQKALQNSWRTELKISKEEALRIYDLLEWCDALSLLVCKGDMQPEQRSVEISTGPDKKKYHLIQVDETTLSVTPWPFEPKKFTVNFDYRTIQQMQFKSSAAFRAAFLEARVKEKNWTFVKMPAAPKKQISKLKD